MAFLTGSLLCVCGVERGGGGGGGVANVSLSDFNDNKKIK